MGDGVFLEYDFGSNHGVDLHDEDCLDWKKVFYGPIGMKVNEHQFGDFGSLLMLTDRWIRNLNNIIYRGSRDFYHGFYDSPLNIGIRRDGDLLRFNADDSADKIWNGAAIETSCSFLAFCNSVGRLHIEAIRAASVRYPALLNDTGFLKDCIMAEEILGSGPIKYLAPSRLL